MVTFTHLYEEMKSCKKLGHHFCTTTFVTIVRCRTVRGRLSLSYKPTDFSPPLTLCYLNKYCDKSCIPILFNEI